MPAKLLYKLLRKKVRDIDMNLVLWIWSTRTRTQTKVLVLILTHFFSTRTHAEQSNRTRTQDLCTRPNPEGNVESHKVAATSYRLTCLSFHVNRPLHSWGTAFSKFDLENPRSRSWVRWTLQVTTWVQYSIDSHPFHSMSISHPIPEKRIFQNLTLKIQGQGHGWGEHWKSQHGSNILSTHIPFIPCQSAIPFLRYVFFKICP